MEQFWRKKTFKILQREWNKRLHDSGFVDAEVELKDDRALKQRATNSYRQANQLERESRVEYFIFVGYMAHNTVFPNEIERYIMVRHSDGATIKEIMYELLQQGFIIKKRHTLTYIIRRWQTKWGIRIWSRRQMNLK